MVAKRALKLPARAKAHRDRADSDSFSLGSQGPFRPAGTIPGTFPSTAGRREAIEFNVPNGFGVGALGLRFNPGGAFTSFHVLSNIDWLLD